MTSLSLAGIQGQTATRVLTKSRMYAIITVSIGLFEHNCGSANSIPNDCCRGRFKRSWGSAHKRLGSKQRNVSRQVSPRDPTRKE